MICNKCKMSVSIKTLQDINPNKQYFCTNCGTQLQPNRCTNSECKEPSFDLLEESTELRKAKDSDCYCLFCGSETEYFKQGLIKTLD